MLAVSVRLSPESERELKKLEQEMPAVYRRAFGFAASLAARRLRATVKKGGGRDGIPAFQPKSDLTKKVHGKGKWFGSLGDA